MPTLPRSCRPLVAAGPVLPLLFAIACSSANPSPAPSQSASDAGIEAAAKATLAATKFGAFEEWASPINDFLAIGKKYQGTKFNAAITELQPFGDRLFFGYGDADYNLGERIPIEMRVFSSAEEPTVEALHIEAEGQGAPQTTPRQSGEEQIDRYRVLDGELWQAGIDSTDPDELWTQANTTPKGIQGNTYKLEGQAFKKRRNINGGEHVHDLATFGGSLYAVGSGADTRTEFEAGQVFRYLWRSTDRGATFTTVTRVQVTEPGKGDTRFVHLLPAAGKLWVFGYEALPEITKIKNVTFDGATVADVPAGEPLQKVFPDGTLALSDGTGFLWGVDISGAKPKKTAFYVSAEGAKPIEALVGSTVLDASLSDTGELVVMAVAGDATDDTRKSWDLRVLVADAKAPTALTEVAQHVTDVRPVSIAGFKGALFLGTAAGKVLRAQSR